MSSHYVAYVPQSQLNTENAEEELEKLYVSDEERVGVQGVVPGSFERYDEGTFKFRYGRWEESERSVVKGTETMTEFNGKSVLLINHDMLVVESANKEFQESIVDLFQQVFTEGTELETVEFSQKALRTALNLSDQLIKAKYLPSNYSDPDYVLASDRRELRQTQFYDDYGQEEIDSLKMFFDTGGEPARISFKLDGKIIINKRRITASEQVNTFRGIHDLITDMAERWGGAQRTLSGSGAESD